MRVDQFRWTLTLDGQDLGVWDKQTGGHGGSEETKYRPGGMGGEVSLGGRATRENQTFTRLYDLERGDNELLRKLDQRRGRGKITASGQPLDVDGHPFGKPDVYAGTLMTVNRPEHDSEGTGPALMEITVSTVGEIG